LTGPDDESFCGISGFGIELEVLLSFPLICGSISSFPLIAVHAISLTAPARPLRTDWQTQRDLPLLQDVPVGVSLSTPPQGKTSGLGS
jgi:hypothetical protein